MNFLNLLIGLSRVAFGAVGFVAPGTINAMSAKKAKDPLANMLMQGLSVRDFVLGWGIIATKTPSERRRWLLAAAAADLGDAVWTLGGWSRLKSPARAVMLGLEIGAAVTEIATGLAAGQGTKAHDESERRREDTPLIVQPSM
jgi:hypothetical protein